MVPFLLVDNSQDSINYMIKIIYSGYTLSRQIIINFIKERKTMALQSFSLSRKTFHHVYKNIFINTTFIFIRLEYIEQFSIDG
jgi:hypothetical protein